jgi:hypothetical protein
VLQNEGLFIGDVIFEAPISFAVGENATPNFVIADDLNGDGVPDLVTVNDDTVDGGSVSVLLTFICPGDANEDGEVDTTDFLNLLMFWGPCLPLPQPCPFDLDDNGTVDVIDFLALLNKWGPCPEL